MFYFGQVFNFCRLINKSVLEWFLLIICKEHTLVTFTNLFNRNHFTLCFWLKRRSSGDAQYGMVILSNWQKQPPEVLYKRSCSLKLCSIHRKTPILESLFNNVANLWKRDSNTGVFLLRNLKNNYFEEHLLLNWL